MVLWDEIFRRVARDYPDVETEVARGRDGREFVLHPEDLAVVVGSNLFADILSDLGSALAGSLGLAASANLNPVHRLGPPMFEPVHGTAPDIAGRGVANPIAAIGRRPDDRAPWPARAGRPVARGDRGGHRGRVLTRDLGGTAATKDVTKALIDALNT